MKTGFKTALMWPKEALPTSSRIQVSANIGGSKASSGVDSSESISFLWNPDSCEKYLEIICWMQIINENISSTNCITESEIWD